MIEQTYKSKNGIKTTEKQALPSVQPETETLVEAVLSASQVSLAAGASAPSSESGSPPHQVIKLGIDVHLDRDVVVRPSRRNGSARASFWSGPRNRRRWPSRFTVVTRRAPLATLLQGGLEPGFCLAPASSCPRPTAEPRHSSLPTSWELERLRSRVEQVYESNSGGVDV